ncbi:carboxy terminal-processing peptidase [Motiliproteus sp. MSK22-1]|uniref:carboxy terminal-processing peptidase n=1 Tax=Motiliproteus sp. MSK22-1 TaxID=1897630 RepID=UPI0009782431|nr:carboxy terminal-processing peptidase [Motiliproteus sp. MSK22-1]OMH36236.1 peptidase S41 [Motiliproteus sp. MSK22-1]
MKREVLMPMLPIKLIKSVTLTVSLLAICSPNLLASTDLPLSKLEPEATHTKTLRSLAKTLRLGHYRKLIVDDQFSSQLFDAYLERLDKNKLYFLASDIEEFESHRYKLDDGIAQSDLDFAFKVFHRYQQRTKERLEYLLTRIEAGLDDLDFELNEQLEADRSEAPWSTNRSQLDDLWRKRLKSTVLNFRLSDKNTSDTEKLLRKRYQNQINRLNQVNSDDVFQSYANALASLYGPHTQYFSPRRSENFDIDMRLSLEGIGAVLQTEYENTKIVRLIPAGPADKTGQIGPGDLVVGVGQDENEEMVDVVGWRLDEVVDLIRGPKGSTVRLQIIPAGSDDKLTKEVVIVRNKVKLEEQAAQKKVLEIERNGKTHKLGLISIPTFYIDFNALRDGDPNYRSTTRDVERLLQELMEEDIEGLIVDLRNNGGGSLREAVDLAGLFIPQGPVVQIKDSWGQVRVEFDQDPKHYEIPLAVMVNRLSASASEIFAGAIKDYNRGILVGSQTFGKGTVQVMHPLNAGQLKLTRAKFYRISGDSTQNKGVMPHITQPSLYDPDEIGESNAKGALPWDQVKPLPHLNFPDFNHLLTSLDIAHQQRIEDEPDFLAMFEQIDYMKQRRQENDLLLNEVALKQRRERDQQWRLDLENRRRHAKNQPPIESYAELEQLAENQHNTDPEKDALLKESGQVLLDFLNPKTLQASNN